MKLSIIGLPGAGKKTVFETLTGVFNQETLQKPENRIGTIRVPDERVDTLSKMYCPKKTIFAQIEYLLPLFPLNRSSQNPEEAFWNIVRTGDAIIHVLRNFKGFGLEDPHSLKDFTTLNEEMILADLMVVEKRLAKVEKDQKRGKKTDQEEIRLLTACLDMLEKEQPLRHNAEICSTPKLKGFSLLSAKPMMVLFNNDDEDDTLPSLSGPLEKEICLAIRGKIEHELSQMPLEEVDTFLEEFGITASAMNRMIAQSYSLLGLISFFTVGPDEVRAWTIKKDTAALEAANVIHSDIKKGFIRAETLAYQDLVEAGSYKDARKRGTVRLEGKTYPVQNGDIIEFRFNV